MNDIIEKIKATLFKHKIADTRYITIPSIYVDDSDSPLKNVRKCKLLLYYVLNGEIVDPETKTNLGKIPLNGNGLLFIIDEKSIEKT